MSSQDLFILFGGLTLILGLIFWIGRRAVRPPSLLDLRRKSTEEPLLSDQSVTQAKSLQTVANGTSKASSGERQLNAIFVWNGHPWDAYEVLGAPAGSPLSNVEKAYRDLISRTDPQSRPFIDAAFGAIKQSLSSQQQKKSG